MSSRFIAKCSINDKVIATMLLKYTGLYDSIWKCKREYAIDICIKVMNGKLNSSDEYKINGKPLCNFFVTLTESLIFTYNQSKKHCYVEDTSTEDTSTEDTSTEDASTAGVSAGAGHASTEGISARKKYVPFPTIIGLPGNDDSFLRVLPPNYYDPVGMVVNREVITNYVKKFHSSFCVISRDEYIYCLKHGLIDFTSPDYRCKLRDGWRERDLPSKYQAVRSYIHELTNYKYTIINCEDYSKLYHLYQTYPIYDNFRDYVDKHYIRKLYE